MVIFMLSWCISLILVSGSGDNLLTWAMQASELLQETNYHHVQWPINQLIRARRPPQTAEYNNGHAKMHCTWLHSSLSPACGQVTSNVWYIWCLISYACMAYNAVSKHPRFCLCASRQCVLHTKEKETFQMEAKFRTSARDLEIRNLLPGPKVNTKCPCFST